MKEVCKVMKKTSIIPIIISLFMLTSCSSPKADMYIENDAYNLTPQEYIDRLNSFVEEQGDSRYLTIPDFEESEEPIAIDSIYLTLFLTTDDSGKITEIRYSWDGTREDIGYSIGLYFSYTFSMLGVEDINLIYDELDMMNVNSNAYETSYDENGTYFSYDTMGGGAFNHLTIAPHEL